MSTIEQRPFTAATNKFAYAQVFTRSTLVHRDVPSAQDGHRRISFLHRRPTRREASH